MPSNHLILCRPLLLLPPIPPSIRVFSSESALCIGWLKVWSFRFSISPFNEPPGLISFGMDWLDLLEVQGNLKSLLQHHSSKALILWIHPPDIAKFPWGSLLLPLAFVFTLCPTPAHPQESAEGPPAQGSPPWFTQSKAVAPRLRNHGTAPYPPQSNCHYLP